MAKKKRKTTAAKTATAPAHKAHKAHRGGKRHASAPSTSLARHEAPGAIEKVKQFSRKVAKKVTHRRGGKMAATKEAGGKGHVLGHIAAGLVGGAAGAAAGGLMVKAGLSPLASAAIVTGAGGVGAYALHGYAKSASVGVGASGAGQLALTLMAKKQTTSQGRTGKKKGRNELPASHDVYDAMAQARREIGPPPSRNDWRDDGRNGPRYYDDERNAPMWVEP